MFDQRQAKAGSALGAALADIDAVEPFRQAWQVLRRDAGTVIANRYDRIAIRASSPARECKIHALARRTIFQRILDEVLEYPDQLVAVPGYDQRPRFVGDP